MGRYSSVDWPRTLTIGSAALGLAMLAALPSQAGGPMAGVETIFLKQEPCGWATRLADGRLMLWWVVGKSTEAENVTDSTTTEVAYARFSSDSGYTWSPTQKLCDFPLSEGAYAGSSILCDRDGVIHLFGIHYFYYSIKGDETAEQLQGIVPGKSPAFHLMSADGGKSWTPPQYCDFGHEYTGSTNGALQLSSGRILLPVSYLSRRVSGRFVTAISYSDDGGKTWKAGRGECIVDCGSRNIESGAMEPVCVELADQRVWMLIRSKTGALFESFSADGGDTWSTPVASRFRSTNAPGSLLRLRDGRLVMVWTNAYQQLARETLVAAISADEGKTWAGYREIARVNRPKNRKASYYHFGLVTYPYLTEAPDGTIIVTFMGAGQTVLRVQPDWLAETTLWDDYSTGLSHWCTLDAEGVTVVDNAKLETAVFTPDSPKTLALRKLLPDAVAGASLNFPFGVQGRLSSRIRIEPGFQGARLCLTDCFSLMSFEEDGRYGIAIGPDGRVSVSSGAGQFTPAEIVFAPGRWYSIGLAWDCAQRTCRLSVDFKNVAVLPYLPGPVSAVTGTYLDGQMNETRFAGEIQAPGICYLRIWSTAKETDRDGIKLDAVSVSVHP